MKFNINEPFKTDNGLEVKIVTERGSDIEFPIIGEVILSANGDLLLTKWDLNGISATGSAFDLVNESATVTGLVVMVKNRHSSFCLGSFKDIKDAQDHINVWYTNATIIGSARVTIKEGEYA